MNPIKQAVNDMLQRGIKYAKVSQFEDVEIVTFSHGTTGKFCFVLNGGVEFSGPFDFDTEMDAYKAALEQIKQENDYKDGFEYLN